jgi:recombination protein RecA
MFSMSAVASFPLDHSELARLGVLQGTETLLPTRAVLGLGWPELEQALPDRGLPRGVVELAALPWLTGGAGRRSWRTTEWISGGATTIAIAAMSAVHAADEKAWCAWISPRSPRSPVTTDTSSAGAERVPSIHAPALVQAGVDLRRLLVVRPTPQALARTAVKVAMSGAFELVVVDAPHRHDLNGSLQVERGGRNHIRSINGSSIDKGTVVVRKLALAAEEYGTTTLLLTNALAERAVPWPVALRLEIERRPEALSIRITKDRRGSSSGQQTVRLPSAS